MVMFCSKFHPLNTLDYTYIDQHLTWQNHIDYVLKKVRGKIYSINRLNPPSSVKKLLYQVYLLPVLDYCDAVWAPTNANQSKRLERCHSKYTSSCIDSFILKYSLSEQRKFYTTVQVYKILHRIVPAYLYNIFEYAINVTGCVSRNVHCLFIPQFNTNYGKYSLYYCGTTMWNALYITPQLWLNSRTIILVLYLAIVIIACMYVYIVSCVQGINYNWKTALPPQLNNNWKNTVLHPLRPYQTEEMNLL